MKINGVIILCFVFMMSFSGGCNFKPEPQPLPLSVRSTLNLLQEDPQFVMYLNFKSMSRTNFWQKNISDSILNAEKTFGSILNTFKNATGVSISNGLDEMYYSNSWFGENSIVLKGLFNKSKLDEYIKTDSLFSITKNAEGKDIYIKTDNGLYFFFKDDFTICASNYLKQIDAMMQISDTSESGLLKNEKIYNSIENIIYKQDLWMVSTEKAFIKGIYQNFLGSTAGIKPEDEFKTDTSGSNENPSDESKEKVTLENLYTKYNSVSFSAEMKDDILILIQNNFVSESPAKFFKSIMNGFLTVSRLSTGGKQKPPAAKLLDKIRLNRYDNDVFIEVKIESGDLEMLRNTDLLSEPAL
ncbi:MAG: hypothetical protein IPM96_00105 [Ignavibacteria bacterium]|nr:hypothetical protein [Ignavibacteria bacterium]